MGNYLPVPYSAMVPEPIQQGCSVVIHGRPHPNCARFSVNLCVGPTLDHDVILHFNPRFDERCVVRNTKQAGRWAGEERDGHIPFSKNVDFELQITVEPNCFGVFVNKRRFCNFNFRLSNQMIQYLYIAGDLSLSLIEYYGATPKSPSGFPYPPSFHQPLAYPSPAPPPYSEQVPGPINNPAVPLTMPIPGGLYAGKLINIKGTVNPRCSRFTVNLMCGPNADRDDIALHFDVRLNFGTDINVVVRTHKANGKWAQEERAMPCFPFSPGAPFEILILAEASCFKIAVNNHHFTDFNHRIYPFQRAGHFNVSGDAQIKQIRFQ